MLDRLVFTGMYRLTPKVLGASAIRGAVVADQPLCSASATFVT
jgi:hypothetical protein